MTKKHKYTDEERRLWVLNDEGLYGWQQTSLLPIEDFIRNNRDKIDVTINSRLGR